MYLVFRKKNEEEEEKGRILWVPKKKIKNSLHSSSCVEFTQSYGTLLTLFCFSFFSSSCISIFRWKKKIKSCFVEIMGNNPTIERIFGCSLTKLSQKVFLLYLLLCQIYTIICVCFNSFVFLFSFFFCISILQFFNLLKVYYPFEVLECGCRAIKLIVV